MMRVESATTSPSIEGGASCKPSSSRRKPMPTAAKIWSRMLGSRVPKHVVDSE